MIRVGTSGWQYRDWRGLLYPDNMPVRRWLEHYAESFATVESNNAFYRLPSRDTFGAWRTRTPKDFLVSVKASRYLTHIKRLRDPAEPVRRLLDRAEGLGGKLGPILLQLPPTLRADAPLLDDCLSCFPRSVRVAVEPRHESWWTDDVRAVLESHGAALAWADRDSHPVTPRWRTTDWAYLRLHAGRAYPPPHYGRQALDSWVHRLLDSWPADADLHVYFNNDPGGAAVGDAITFARLADRAGAPVTRVPEPAKATAGRSR
ncbi:DUF72 domain-containing protein [Nocardia asteroides]|uniref:DUF72 domain-containing protein n=1 Tax=Nocardia asteroides TaxID=1824 RepID=UPI001E5782A4|nr:DUF72 domain-containing protein [Nocardia asteroides]UGT54282.1 DUF72 domain-containing protein [Nocardia asteroides]